VVLSHPLGIDGGNSSLPDDTFQEKTLARLEWAFGYRKITLIGTSSKKLFFQRHISLCIRKSEKVFFYKFKKPLASVSSCEAVFNKDKSFGLEDDKSFGLEDA
jgi:hypothetical protein